MKKSQNDIVELDCAKEDGDLNETRFRFLGGMLLVQGVAGYLLLLARVFLSQNYGLFATIVMLLIPLPPVVVGIMLWRQKSFGIWLAIVLCIIQLPYVEINSHVFSCRFGLAYILRFPLADREVGINLVALFILFVLCKFYPDKKEEKWVNPPDL